MQILYSENNKNILRLNGEESLNKQLYGAYIKNYPTFTNGDEKQLSPPYIRCINPLTTKNVDGGLEYTFSDDKNGNLKLYELENINKQDYCYTTLFFPNYKLENGEYRIRYDYLLTTILVGFLLKTRKQSGYIEVGTRADTVCMVTPDVEFAVIELLKKFFNRVTTVKYICPDDSGLPDNVKKDCELITDVSMGKLNGGSYSKVFTKLHMFDSDLFPYKRVIFLDSDLYPLGYFDTLFSLHTPAGWIEHRRHQTREYGVHSWYSDRGKMFPHGSLIHHIFTDIHTNYASDVNASLILIKPDKHEYNDMINELKTDASHWFGSDKIHRGFWSGDTFIDAYCLPEQNYLTQRYSGSWNSIDMRFSTWCTDLDSCLGFTFAGITVKPWNIQSKMGEYTTNVYSDFSIINNKYSDRTTAYEIFNTLLYNMLYNNRDLLEYLELEISTHPYDSWCPETPIRRTPLSQTHVSNLSPSQLLLYSLYSNDKIISTIDTYNRFFFKISNNVFNPTLQGMIYVLISKFYKIAKDCGLLNRIFAFGNTFTSLCQRKMLDICDDDADFIIVFKNRNYGDKLLHLLKKILEDEHQVFLNIEGKFVQLIRNDYNLPYIKYKNKDEYMTIDNIKLDRVKFFNISYYRTFLNTRLKGCLLSSDKTSTPWIDIFLSYIDENEKIDIIASDKKDIDKSVFFNMFGNPADSIKIDIIDIFINIPDKASFCKSYYKDDLKLKKYILKEKHSSASERKKIIDIRKGDIEWKNFKRIYNIISDVVKKMIKNEI